MRMLKGSLFITLVVAAIMLLSLASGAYFFDVNDHREWISERIKQSTGYDIRFQQFESHWLSDSRLSLRDVQLYEQQQQIARINSIDINIAELDLWQRSLSIESINVKGVALTLNSALLRQTSVSEDNETSASQTMAWKKLHINHIQIADIDADISTPVGQLEIVDMDIETDNISVIDDKKLQILAQDFIINSHLNKLNFNDEKSSVQLNNIDLFVQGGLASEQVSLALQGQNINLGVYQQAVELNEVNLNVQLDKQGFSVQDLALKAFSGDLRLQAGADWQIQTHPEFLIKLDLLTLHSLLVKDMKLPLNSLPHQQAQGTSKGDSSELPIEKLLAQQVTLKNIAINASESIPLQVSGLDLHLQDILLIEQQRWLDLTKAQSQGQFSLIFDHLGWDDTTLQHFSAQGSLNNDHSALHLLQQQLLKQ